MKMTAILNDKFGDEIDSEIRRDTGYIKANKEFHRFVSEEIPEEKAEQLKETVAGSLPLWATLMSKQE